jgi:arylsulfatase A-like enzyme
MMCVIGAWFRYTTLLRISVYVVGIALSPIAMGEGGGEKASVGAQASDRNSVRPNIVFILADDLGFSDIEPYGSEVNTPALTALAESGVRFTNYHTAANCAPARAMLLTGVSNHLAGVPNIPEMLAPAQRVQDNYQGVLGSNVVTLATLL